MLPGNRQHFEVAWNRDAEINTFLLFFRPALADNWYSLSYLYFSTLGTLITVIVGIIISLLTGTSSRAVIEYVLDLFRTTMTRELSLPQEVPVTLLQLCKCYHPKSHFVPSALLHPTLAHSKSYFKFLRKKKVQQFFLT